MTFRVAFVPGVTPTKWFRVWQERQETLRPGDRVPIEAVPIESLVTGTDPLAVLRDDEADVALLRLPVDRDGIGAITLYSEVPVVVVPKDHVVTAVDEIDVAELAEERMLEVAIGPTGGPDAVELVAAGVGVLVLPKSVARLYGRKDVEARPVTGLPETEIALVWIEERRSPQVDEFIGVVRGRTANSSRAADDAERAAIAASGRKPKATDKAKARAAEARAAAAKAQPKSKAKPARKPIRPRRPR
ncbi:LysR substrate-binding domain-containing protein [Herbiconiux sp. CPCC 205763]|uniref:LysR substrate-binding domain-containing protein n=1 Tax=Herbiconiux aconitum TaxID=2970913 RepID=A0ABT2GN42_9MICO|nr:LysR substrate-binding domain-containing protein [Herbiconiux aconitum]MCS5717593.1 LysR substrate-binding domain-containing protein [Herbiconiux aconitum]